MTRGRGGSGAEVSVNHQTPRSVASDLGLYPIPSLAQYLLTLAAHGSGGPGCIKRLS